ncbi:MAG: PilN domain-containing protein [Nitrospiraceae bacterium]
MRTPWRSFFSSLFSSLQAGGGAPGARPPVHPLHPNEQRVPGSLSLPTLHLSLTASGFLLLRVVQWGLTFAIAGLTTVALWFWWDSRVIDELAAQRERATGRVQETNRQFDQQAAQAGMDVSEARAKELGHQVAFVNRLTEQRAFSWTRFLSDLEDAVSPHISISSVGLDFKENVITLNGAALTHFKENVITLNGTALTLKDLTTMVNKLDNHPAFRNVVLSQHRFLEPAGRGESSVPGKDEAKTVEFTMTVTYRPRS